MRACTHTHTHACTFTWIIAPQFGVYILYKLQLCKKYFKSCKTEVSGGIYRLSHTLGVSQMDNMPPKQEQFATIHQNWDTYKIISE